MKKLTVIKHSKNSKFMKKIIMLVAAVGILAASHVTFAASCDVNNPCVSGNGNPALVVGGWGTTNSGVPNLTIGQSATDDNGISSTCQWMSGCVDIYHTKFYKNQISILRDQLGDSEFIRWVNIAKVK